MVDNVIMFDDHDDTAIEAIIKTKRFYQLADVIFAKWVDRTADNIPEEEYFYKTIVLHLSIIRMMTKRIHRLNY